MVSITKIFLFILIISSIPIIARESNDTSFIDVEFKIAIEQYKSKMFVEAQKKF